MGLISCGSQPKIVKHQIDLPDFPDIDGDDGPNVLWCPSITFDYVDEFGNMNTKTMEDVIVTPHWYWKQVEKFKISIDKIKKDIEIEESNGV